MMTKRQGVERRKPEGEDAKRCEARHCSELHEECNVLPPAPRSSQENVRFRKYSCAVHFWVCRNARWATRISSVEAPSR
jgi:hypothetical protein